MTYNDIEITFRKEVQASYKKIDEVAKKFGGDAKKTRIYPCIRYYSVNTKNKIKLGIIFFADKRSCWDHPRVCFYKSFYFNNSLHFISVDDAETGFARIYTLHYLNRYKKRVLNNPDITNEGLIRHYLTHNEDLMWYKNGPIFSPDYRKYEHDNVPQMAARIEDGNCFIERLGDKLYLFKTFISDDMLYETQSDSFEKIERMRQAYKARDLQKSK